jgi:hypothetical protein
LGHQVCINIKTIDHALQTVKKQIKLIQMKLTPSPIAVYLINTVIIPCLLYRLQISCVPVKTIANINSLFRKLVKQKFSFMRNLHSNLLYDINFGMKLHDVAIKRSQQLITNTNVHIRDCNVTGILFRFCTLDISSQFPHIHESILVCPIKTVSRKRPLFIKHLSNLLFNERLQIRNPIEHTDHKNILQSLPLYTYNKHYQILSKRKIRTLDNILHPTEPNVIVSYDDALR